MSLFHSILNILFIIMQVFTGIIGVYQIFMSLFGIWHRKDTSFFEPRKRFAVLVPAHNEERVVGPLVDSLMAQKYPRQLFDVHVIADNCTDHTREVALKLFMSVSRRTSEARVLRLNGCSNVCKTGPSSTTRL